MCVQRGLSSEDKITVFPSMYVLRCIMFMSYMFVIPRVMKQALHAAAANVTENHIKEVSLAAYGGSQKGGQGIWCTCTVTCSHHQRNKRGHNKDSTPPCG